MFNHISDLKLKNVSITLIICLNYFSFSQKLAHDAGLHRTYISLLEKGKRQPSLSSTINLANALETELGSLLKPFMN
jgi:transcriptional regulator with XRE-family HTH domain